MAIGGVSQIRVLVLSNTVSLSNLIESVEISVMEISTDFHFTASTKCKYLTILSKCSHCLCPMKIVNSYQSRVNDFYRLVL